MAAPARGLCCQTVRAESTRTPRRSVTERHHIAASLWVSVEQLGVGQSNYFETSRRTVEAIPGSRSSNRSAVRRRLSHRNHSRKVKMFIFFPGGFESLFNPLVCWNHYVLNCHWGAKCRRRKRTWNSDCAANVPWNSAWGANFYQRRPPNAKIQNQVLKCYKRTGGAKLKGAALFSGQPSA